jgi:hypothetical protein
VLYPTSIALLKIWWCIWRAPSTAESDIYYLSVPCIFKRALPFLGDISPLCEVSAVFGWTLLHFQELSIIFGCALPSVRPLVEGISDTGPHFSLATGPSSSNALNLRPYPTHNTWGRPV